jgi:hypothetical protein
VRKLVVSTFAASTRISESIQIQRKPTLHSQIEYSLLEDHPHRTATSYATTAATEITRSRNVTRKSLKNTMLSRLANPKVRSQTVGEGEEVIVADEAAMAMQILQMPTPMLEMPLHTAQSMEPSRILRFSEPLHFARKQL